MNVSELFNQLRKEAKEANIDEDRMRLLDLLEVEMKAGFKVSDVLATVYPEIIEVTE